jgi:hypothetical protein
MDGSGDDVLKSFMIRGQPLSLTTLEDAPAYLDNAS